MFRSTKHPNLRNALIYITLPPNSGYQTAPKLNLFQTESGLAGEPREREERRRNRNAFLQLPHECNRNVRTYDSSGHLRSATTSMFPPPLPISRYSPSLTSLFSTASRNP
ncbi:hypothetical protein KFK09_028724 [Dendrobium nobile]|uniref:Uncharacterized protein n=1 Tax=Dendrobium nobile TaxID=94219 RepID=A0A8T3A2C9_DENNO|nr:hypothetical protein KFK09_028724 [Dendrobium nobile]